MACLPKGGRVNGLPERRGQRDIHVLLQVAPAQVIQAADTRLQNEIVNILGKLPELLRRGKAEGRLLDCLQELFVLRGKGGNRRPDFW